MDLLYHRTTSLLEEAGRYFSRLERCGPDNVAETEAQIQSLLDSVWEQCNRLDILVGKEAPGRRVSARMQVDQLKYDHKHYQSSLHATIQRRLQREQEASDREQLLSRKFTTIQMDNDLQHQQNLAGAHRGVDDLLGQGAGVLNSLREQKGTLKGARKKLLDMATSLGLSNTVMRLIEKRAHQDKFVLFGGMIVTCGLMYLILRYLT